MYKFTYICISNLNNKENNMNPITQGLFIILGMWILSKAMIYIKETSK